MENYYIKTGYKCNLDFKGQSVPYLDEEFNSLIFQFDVYKFAKKILKKDQLKSVLDIGCGYGLKLKNLSKNCNNIVGIDSEHSINFCKQQHHFGQWFTDNIENPNLNLNQKFDLIIVSDVIEHLVDPDKLLSYIKRYSHDNTFVILSTPERDLIYGNDSFGPSSNTSHVREWNEREFKEYINNKGFKVIKHFLVRDYNMAASIRTIKLTLFSLKLRIIKKLFISPKTCQVILCKLKNEV